MHELLKRSRTGEPPYPHLVRPRIGQIVALAKPTYDGSHRKAVRTAADEDSRLEAAKSKLNVQSVSDAYSAKVNAHVEAIAKGATNDPLDARIESLAAEYASQREAIEGRQATLRQSVASHVKALCGDAATAVEAVVEKQEAAEIAACASIGIPFEPSAVLRAAATAYHYLQAQATQPGGPTNFANAQVATYVEAVLPGVLK